MSAQPIFETDRLLLRPRTLEDLDSSVAMDRQPGVTTFVDGPWGDPDRHRAFVLDRITRSYPPGQGYWSIFAKDAPDHFIGWVLLIPEDAVGPETEIGWRLVPEVWGHGYATEAATPLLQHALEMLRLPRVIADIHPDNTASRKVAEKIGMAPTGVGDETYRRYMA